MTSFITKTAAAIFLSASLIACNSGDSPKDVTADISAAKTPEAAKAIAEKEIKDMSPIEMMEYATENSNALADTLAAVNDEPSAQAAIAELRALGPRMEAMGDQLKDLDQSELSLSLKTMSVVTDFGKAQMRLAAETARIAKDHPELRPLFEKEFEDIELSIQ